MKLAVKGEFTASDTVTQHVSVYYSEYKHHLEDLDSIFTFSEHYDIVLDGKNTPVEVSISQCDPSKLIMYEPYTPTSTASGCPTVEDGTRKTS